MDLLETPRATSWVNPGKMHKNEKDEKSRKTFVYSDDSDVPPLVQVETATHSFGSHLLLQPACSVLQRLQLLTGQSVGASDVLLPTALRPDINGFGCVGRRALLGRHRLHTFWPQGHVGWKNFIAWE